MNRKLGPLPLWAWGAIGIAGVLFGLYLRSRLSASSQSSSSGVGTQPSSASDLSNAAAGGGGSSVAPVASDNPDLIAALMNAQNAFADIAVNSTSDALGLASNVNANSFGFAEQAASWLAMPPMYQIGSSPSSGGGGGGGSVYQPPPSYVAPSRGITQEIPGYPGLSPTTVLNVLDRSAPAPYGFPRGGVAKAN